MSPVRRIPRILGPIVGTVAVVAVLLLGVFPTRTYLDQRRATATAGEQLRVLREQNAALEHRVAELHDDAEIERLAREQYNLVLPGEEAYALLPAPEAGPAAAGAAAGAPAVPDDGQAGAGVAAGAAADADVGSPNLFERALDAIAGLF